MFILNNSEKNIISQLQQKLKKKKFNPFLFSITWKSSSQTTQH